MAAARQKGRNLVCGWEANGGFLLGSDVERNRKVLKALPTRDAFLPMLAVLFSARGKNITLPNCSRASPIATAGRACCAISRARMGGAWSSS